MKKEILFLLIVISSNILISQSLPKITIETNDDPKPIIVNIPGVDKDSLYKLSINSINLLEYYYIVSGIEIINKKENEFEIIGSYADSDFVYTDWSTLGIGKNGRYNNLKLRYNFSINLSFKDEKYRFKVNDIKLYSIKYKTDKFESPPIFFKSNGKVKNIYKYAVPKIEYILNYISSEIYYGILKKKPDNDW